MKPVGQPDTVRSPPARVDQLTFLFLDKNPEFYPPEHTETLTWFKEQYPIINLENYFLNFQLAFGTFRKLFRDLCHLSDYAPEVGPSYLYHYATGGVLASDLSCISEVPLEIYPISARCCATIYLFNGNVALHLGFY